MKPARGFTLLEVLLAFVILAAASGLLLGMLSGGLGQVARARSDTEASLYAQSLLDGVGVLAPIAPGARDGEFGGGRYHYRLQIAEVPDPAPAPPDSLASTVPVDPATRPRWFASSPKARRPADASCSDMAPLRGRWTLNGSPARCA